MIKSRLTIVLWVIVTLLVAVIILLAIRYGIGPFKKSDSYYAVSLVGGGLYFGKLSQWPTLTLSDVWLIQQDINATSTPNLSLNKFTNLFWGPEDKIKLNWDNVVMISKLHPDSQIIQTIKSQPNSGLPSSQVAPGS